ncbi:hypothetical protein [Sorangium sp. So ce388]|uniref:hypothetical protein n=1 Tax=Sorangium sp. So ce388 TaxID=3133309 RepID=UPI003F5B4023
MKAPLLSGLVLAALLASSSARAADVRIDIGFDAGWMIWGDSAVRGRRANPTGGIVFIPSARLSLPIPGVSWLDAQYTQAPMVLAPFSEQTGLVDANDLGVEFHTPDGALGFALAGTVAPMYATFCNPEWCYPEALVAWGGTARLQAELSRDERGRAARVTISARLLYAEPTAWNWPGLDPELRRVVPTSTMLTAGGSWSW